jgi:acyl-CoA oxidase
MVEGLAAFAGQSYLSPAEVSSLRRALEVAVANSAPHIDSLVEALGFTEFELDSVFARGDKTPYEALWEGAKQSELNDNAFIRPSLLYARNLWRKYPSSKL